MKPFCDKCGTKESVSYHAHFDSYHCPWCYKALLEAEQEYREANAKLIAAAPELLEACQELTRLLQISCQIVYSHQHYIWNERENAIQKAEAIIVKATT